MPLMAFGLAEDAEAMIIRVQYVNLTGKIPSFMSTVSQ